MKTLGKWRSIHGSLNRLFFNSLLIIALAIAAFFIVAFWKIFTKAGQPGWACLVPIYNMVILLKIVAKPVWWLILFFVPVVSFVIAIIVYLELAKVFGKSTGFGVGLIFLPFIFIPILAFGSAEYSGPAAA